MDAGMKSLIIMFVNPKKEKLKISLFKYSLAVQRGVTLENAMFE